MTTMDSNHLNQEEILKISKQKPIKPTSMIRGDGEEDKEVINEEIDWDEIENYELENENGSKIVFSDVYYDVKTIVIFIRVGVLSVLTDSDSV